MLLYFILYFINLEATPGNGQNYSWLCAQVVLGGIVFREPSTRNSQQDYGYYIHIVIQGKCLISCTSLVQLVILSSKRILPHEFSFILLWYLYY